MRFVVEIILVAALIVVAWEKSLKDRAREIPWPGQLIASEKPMKPAPTASPSGAWMWDPNRRTVLDTPPPKALSSTPPSWMFDPNHRSSLDRSKPTQATPH
jgi:hypothetical protein